MSKTSFFSMALGAAALMLAAAPAQAVPTTTVSVIINDNNDCGTSGAFNFPGGTGFSNCAIWAPDDQQTPTSVSPVIAQFGTSAVENGSGTPTDINSLYTSITGVEWTFNNNATNGDNEIISGDWAYTPTGDDPAVRFWIAKSANTNALYYILADTDLTGCSTPTELLSLGCLNLAQEATSGSWDTTNNKELSHITFFNGGANPPCETDCEPPCEKDCNTVPEPTALLITGSGLVAVGAAGAAMRRRRNNA